MSISKKRLLPAMFAGAVGLALSLSGLNAAQAAPIIPSPGATGSITVHKFQQPLSPTGLPNNGMALTAAQTAALTPIAGVTFSVQQVQGIDLSTNAGWTQYQNLTPSAPPTNLGPATTLPTLADGSASFTNLPIGVYYVKETAWPAGVTPAAPFLISVPLTDPTNLNNWIYNVNAYPKNAVTTATKTVNDASAVKLGDPVVYTILGDLPRAVNPIDGYKITDTLDPKLTYVSTAVTLTNSATTLTPVTDYSLVFDAATNTVSVQFTAAGLAKLTANDTNLPPSQVQLVLTTKANADGVISNVANVYPNQASFTIAPGQPGGPIVTPPVVTKWGDVIIHKVGTGNVNLPGAQFAIYANKADATAQTNAIATATTDANGLITFTGLRYSCFANGVAIPGCPPAAGQPWPANSIDYWVTELKAPAGYELLANPVEVQVTGTGATATTYTVTDVPSNGGFQLPLTGSTGTAIFSIAGVALLLGAGLFVMRSRRRDEDETKAATK